jgi:FMN phosphatase YigB (HAD superfamily)
MKQEEQPLSDIKAVTFDVGNTLITTWPSVGHVYADIAARNGLAHLTAALLEERFRAV